MRLEKKEEKADVIPAPTWSIHDLRLLRQDAKEGRGLSEEEVGNLDSPSEGNFPRKSVERVITVRKR